MKHSYDWMYFCIQVVATEKSVAGSTFPGEFEIVNIDTGEKKTTSSLFTESPYTLFILLRHYAWPPWHNHIQAVENSISEFQQLGCRVVLLTYGTKEDGVVYRKAHPSQFPAYCDSQRTLYRQLGLRRILKILTTTAMCKYGERKMKGLPFPDLIYEDDDLWIMGGDFIVKSDGKILFSLLQTTYYERPSIQDLLSCLKAQPAIKWTTNVLTCKVKTVHEVCSINLIWKIASDWLSN